MAEPNTLDLFRLDGRIALVTGGSRGLGRSMALALAEAGATVVLCGRNQETLDEAAASVCASASHPCVGLRADVTREEEVQALFAEVLDRFGRLDVLINNAGTNLRRPIEDYSVAEYQTIVDINLTGVWLCCREDDPILKRQRSGSVINIASVMSWIALPERTVYAASKAALLGLTRVLALEWAPFGARCNAICPGPFLTEMNQPLVDNPETASQLVDQTAFRRWGELHEIRGAALFLASEASSYVTGASLTVDGGWTAR